MSRALSAQDQEEATAVKTCVVGNGASSLLLPAIRVVFTDSTRNARRRVFSKGTGREQARAL